jgi:beta-glucosidase
VYPRLVLVRSHRIIGVVLAALVAFPAIVRARPPRAVPGRSSARSPLPSSTPPTSGAHPRDAAWWRERNRAINEAPGRADARLIFLGDSITEGWPTVGREVWEKHYARRRALVMGISGDRARHVLWRIRHGNLDGLAPRVVVLLIGANDACYRDTTASRIAEGIVAIVQELRARLPLTHVLLVGVFPCGPRPSARRTRIAEANRLAAAVADGKMVHYLDLGARLLRPDRTLSAKVAYDYLHLTAAGYQIWATAMEPKLRQLLGER